MRDQDITSTEQLDALLATGKISEQEHAALRKAMEATKEEESRPKSRTPSRTVCRSSTERVIAGVCGGIAKSMGADPWIVRIGAILLLLFTGGTAVVAYLVVALALPASDEQGTVGGGARLGGFPWAFAATVVLLWIIHTAFLTFVVPRFQELWDAAGAELPGPTILFVNLSTCIRSWSLLVLLPQAGLCVLLVTLYALLPKGSAGRVALWVLLLLGFAVWTVFSILALYMPLFRVGDIIK
jgi:phage shock protein C